MITVRCHFLSAFVYFMNIVHSYVHNRVMAVSDKCPLSDEMRTLCFVVWMVDTNILEGCFAHLH